MVKYSSFRTLKKSLCQWKIKKHAVTDKINCPQPEFKNITLPLRQPSVNDLGDPFEESRK